MNERFVRIYNKIDISSISKHLLIYGDLSAQCAHCQEMELKLDDKTCPKCHTEFKYISFRNVANHFPKLQIISVERPDILLVDYDDYKKQLSAQKAKEFLK